MNVYDFDGTLYKGDSTRDFLLFCLRRHPRVALALPRAGVAALACLGLHAIDKTRFKGELYRFLTCVPDVEGEMRAFWATHERNIGGPCRPAPGDVVISASPEFLLRDVCANRGLELLASRVDPHTGRVLGPNCSGEEKVRRFRKRYPQARIERFYSDSHNDDPLANLAERAYFVSLRTRELRSWGQDR